ncbi:MAG: hypothetical protein MI862_26510 [Desulfobacterales bacterium]|nr:hypothetical protein [Desulfobacterales bacterium]
MSELHIPTLRRIAERQLKDNGRISATLLDTIIEDWGVDYSRYKDQARAKDLWHNLVSLYLINPELYTNANSYIKGIHDTLKVRKEKGDDIPDIIA